MGTLLAFTYAANALLRFRGMHDRLMLILGFGFVITGLDIASMMLAILSPPWGTRAKRVALPWKIGCIRLPGRC